MGAGLWSLLETGGGHALRLASNLIMTRILMPEAFGLMAMVSTLHIGLVLLSDIGIANSVIRSERGETALYLRVAWVLQALRGAVLAALVVLAGLALWWLAPVLAPEGTVYAEPELPGLILLSAPLVLMEGLVSTNVWAARRRLEFSRLTFLALGSQAVSLLAMLAYAQISPTVWALLGGSLTGTAAKLTLTHLVLAGPRMAPAWDREIAAEIWHFGKWLLGSSGLTFLAQNADRLILGALLTTQQMGFYVIALTWVQAAALVGQQIAGHVGLPALSSVNRERPHDLPRVFRRFSTAIDALLLPACLVCLAGGPLLIGLLYTDAYAPAGPYMSLLALLVATARFMPFEHLLQSRGDSRTMMDIAALRAAAICAGLPLLYAAFGVPGALLATALAPMAGVPLLLRRAAPILAGRVRRDWAIAAAILVAGVLLAYARGAG